MKSIEYLNSRKSESMEELKELLRIPSISAQSKYKRDMSVCAEWVETFLKRRGFETRIIETPGYPAVYAEMMVSDDLPTVLVYGHYDVQPVDPVEDWFTDPFNPIEKDGYLIARGASDDKGQFFTHMKSCEALIEAEGGLPLNVKFLIEGEEEAAENHLDELIEEHKELLKADVALVSDSAQYGIDLPAITYALRGITAMEITVTGPDKDLHSGAFGGAVPNPVNTLCSIIGKLQDEKGRITVPGFYDSVRDQTEWERDQAAALPFNHDEFLEYTGCKSLHGEEGFTTTERKSARPTLDCNGIFGGYQGEGLKTIVPSTATAKLSMRLVADMDPADTYKKVEKYILELCPDYVDVKITDLGGAYPVQVPVESDWLKAAGEAVKEGFGKKPLFTKDGGSIPVVGTFSKVLGIDTLLIGWGQEDDNIHSPNERFRIEDFHRGCTTSAMILKRLSEVKK